MPQTFAACPLDRYVRWLQRYVRNGGQITHVYDYPYDRAGFLLAVRDFRLGGECGSRARPVVVPSTVRFLGGDLGHCNLYFEADDTGDAHGSLWVPVYSDPMFGAVPGYAEAVEAAAQREQDWRAHLARERAEQDALAADSDLTAHIESERDWA